MPRERLFLVIMVLLAVAGRLWLSLGTDLYFDEAYYWLWSQRLALSYYDHPPLIAVLIRVFSIRPTALLCGFGMLAALYGFARDVHQNANAGWRAFALGAVVPAWILAGVFATPDAPLLLLWTVSLWAFYREKWLLGGALLGLAMLSKYTAVLLGAVVVLDMLRQRKMPKGLVAGMAVALVFFAPVLVWNAAQAGQGFAFQLRHGLGGASSTGGFASFAQFLGDQLLMAGPVLFGLSLGFIRPSISRPTPSPTPSPTPFTLSGAKRSRNVPPPALLRIAALVPLCAFAIASFRTRGEANWAMMAYVPVVVWISGKNTRAFAVASVSGLALCLAGFLHLAYPLFGPARQPPIARTQGWNVLRELRNEGARAIFAPSYQLASEAAYYTRLPTGVAGERRKSQFDFWPEPQLAPGSDALWLSEGPPPPAELTHRFAATEGPRHLLSHYRGNEIHDFHVWRLKQAIATPRSP